MRLPESVKRKGPRANAWYVRVIVVIACCVHVQDNMLYTDTAGTLSFTAPEVMKRRYNKEADIWWVGVG